MHQGYKSPPKLQVGQVLAILASGGRLELRRTAKKRIAVASKAVLIEPCSLDAGTSSKAAVYLVWYWQQSQLEWKKDIARSEVGLRPSGASLIMDE